MHGLKFFGSKWFELKLFRLKLLGLGRSVALLCTLAVVSCQPLSDAQSQPKHTASPQVQVLPVAVPMTELQRQRTIRLYLPPSYGHSDRRYPVLYMHDGQNLFDAATGYAGEWQVDETLDRLADSGQLELIVVGIDNGAALRNQELVPFVHPEIGKAEGEAYLRFIINDLKPYIDRQYRTLPSREHTGLMGSSLGGLITHYAGQHHSDVFGRFGVLSPSYWVAGDEKARLSTPGIAEQSRWFVSMGGNEGDIMVADFQQVTAQLQRDLPKNSQLTLQLVAGAEHNEAAWAALMEPALLALFGNNPPRQLLLSRHMEKAEGSDDPALSPCGMAQAQAFAAQFKATALPKLFHTPYRRTQQTAQAFLQSGRALQSYDPRQVEPLLAELNASTDNALVVGHSNTIPALVTTLTGEQVAPLGEQDYGRIYILTQQQQKWQLEIRQLPLPAECQAKGL